MPIRYATPAHTPPSQPSARTMPSPRIQSKNRVPRPAKPERGPPYGPEEEPASEGGGVGESYCVTCLDPGGCASTAVWGEHPERTLIPGTRGCAHAVGVCLDAMTLTAAPAAPQAPRPQRLPLARPRRACSAG